MDPSGNVTTDELVTPSGLWQHYNVVAVAVSFACLLLVIYLRNRKNLRLPPGPPTWPVIGNLHQLGKLPHQSLASLSKEYGPIMSFKLGSKLAVIVSSPDIAREVLKTQDQIFASRPFTTNADIFCHGRQEVVWAPYGPFWRFLRKVCVLELLTAKRITQFQKIRDEEILQTVRGIIEAGSGNKIVADIEERFSEASSNNITRMLFNKAFFGPKSVSDVTALGEKEEWKALVRECLRIGGAHVIGDLIPILRPLDVGGTKAQLWKLRNKFDAFFLNIIDQHRHRKNSNTETDDVEDFVEVLLALQDDDGKPLTDSLMIALLGDLMLAGTDTSSNQIAWTLAELLRHPQVLKKVQLELHTVVGEDRLVKESDLPQLKYLQAVIKESFRLHPVGPLLIPHESVADTKVAGYDVPAKTRVMVNVYAIQRDPRVWENPLSFDPERFVNKSVDVKGQDFELLPFGSGRRMCPGINLGLLIVGQTLAQLLHLCDFSLPPGVRAEDISMEESFGMTVPRVHPLQVLVTPRFPRWSELQATV